jgi:hypothetical protein
MFVLFLSTSRLTFVKKKIYYGWIDRSKKITLFDYVGNFDGDWISRSIDYAGLISNSPHDKLLKECVEEVRVLKIISAIAGGLAALALVVSIILENVMN